MDGDTAQQTRGGEARGGDTRAGDVRSRILEAATRLFAGRGMDGVSLQEIAEAVGIRKASLLYHFPTKEELHRSVLGELLSRWNEALPRLLRAAAGDDRFDAILDETVAFFLADPDRARLLLREVLDRPRDMRRLLVTHASSWMGLIADSIRKAQSAGAVRPDVDPEAWVLQVIHLVVGSVSTWSATGVLMGARADRPPARVIRELVRVARTSLMNSDADTTSVTSEKTSVSKTEKSSAGRSRASGSITQARRSAAKG